MENHHVSTFFLCENVSRGIKMKKGQIWTIEQKSEIIGKHFNEPISVRTLEKEYNAEKSMICHW